MGAVWGEEKKKRDAGLLTCPGGGLPGRRERLEKVETVHLFVSTRKWRGGGQAWERSRGFPEKPNLCC